MSQASRIAALQAAATYSEQRVMTYEQVMRIAKEFDEWLIGGENA